MLHSFLGRCALLATLLVVGGCPSDDETGGGGGIVTPTPERTLTITGAGSGSGRVTSLNGAINCTITGGQAGSQGCVTRLTEGSTITLNITESTGSVIGSWSSICQSTGTNSCTVRATSLPATIAIRFDAAAPPTPKVLTIIGSGNGSGRVQSATGVINCTVTAGSTSATGCSATLSTSATSFGLTAIPNAGSTFVGWSSPCQSTGPTTCTLPAASLPTNLTAQFVIGTTSTEVNLGIAPIAQSLSQWCWLASGEMVFRYYGVPPVNQVNYQCGVLAMLAGVNSPCFYNCTLCNAGAPTIAHVHQMVVSYPTYANQYYGGGVRPLQANWTSSPLSDSQMMQQLDNRMPMIVGVSPSGFRFAGQQSEHAVVITGYRMEGGIVSFLVNDPWPYGNFLGQPDPYLAGGGVRIRAGQYLISSAALRSRLVLREAVYNIR
jgi:hypothetical protein